MLEGGIDGRAQIAEIKARLGIIPEQLRKDLGKGIREALKPLKDEIKAEAVERMPARHGYGELLARGIKVSTRVSTASVTEVKASVTVSAKGKVENRDVKARNRGEMRHPLFGHKKHWYLTRVRPGFVDDPVKSAERRVTDNARDARDKAADELLR